MNIPDNVVMAVAGSIASAVVGLLVMLHKDLKSSIDKIGIHILDILRRVDVHEAQIKDLKEVQKEHHERITKLENKEK